MKENRDNLSTGARVSDFTQLPLITLHPSPPKADQKRAFLTSKAALDAAQHANEGHSEITSRLLRAALETTDRKDPDMPDARFTLALDELITDPRYDHLLKQARDRMPIAYRDQQDAATDHVRAGVHRLAERWGGGDMIRSGASQVPEWIRLSVLDIWARFVNGEADTCRHNPTWDAPRPIVASPWKPNLVTCGDCAHLFPPPRDSVDNRTCDKCGHIATFTDADLIYPCGVQLGQMWYQFALCGTCREDTTGEKLP